MKQEMNIKYEAELPKNVDTNVIDSYVKQEAERHAFEIDKKFWLVVKEKPRWMPSFIYRAVIKNSVEFIKIKI